MAEKYQIIGECEVNEKGGIVKIDSGLFRQGYVKDVHISFEGAEDTDGYRFGAAPGQIREEKKEKQMAEKIIIGECEVDGKGRIVKMNRGWFQQGYVYKNYEAYYKDKSAVCYVPEFPDTVYSRGRTSWICATASRRSQTGCLRPWTGSIPALTWTNRAMTNCSSASAANGTGATMLTCALPAEQKKPDTSNNWD